jgi:hypothetical protein
LYKLMVCRWSKASTIAAPPLLALPASRRVIVAATLKGDLLHAQAIV